MASQDSIHLIRARRRRRHVPARATFRWLLLMFAIACGGSACGNASLVSTGTAIGSVASVPNFSTPLVNASVVRVVDGDTLIVNINGDQERLRLIGMNTPELNKPDGPVECYATEATERTQELIDAAGGHVQLERDVSETDQYGRLLRYVWLLNPYGRQMLNEELVKGGFARATTYRPDVRYQSILNRDQSDAQSHRLGLWGSCN